VACATLPDGRVVAVTGSADRTVRVWDLLTGTPTGQPLTGHTRSVLAVACATLPDGRVIAVTGSADRTVRVWDLQEMQPLGEALPAIDSVLALTITDVGGPCVVVAGDGIAAVQLRHAAR
jgi:WD40 repeat protein